MIGKRFGNYRATALLGEGGMGAVYLAEHPEIGRKVAIKVLQPSLVKNEQVLQRFLNEARAANAIRHPNIIEILDSGTAEDGVPYLVMEFLDGESIASRLKRGRLPVSMALEFAYQIASAVGAAHRKAIVHRDLKPDNLFIIPDPHEPGRERIKVLDFGIAKLQSADGPDHFRTRTGTMMGTPVYMSPEQCLGTREVDQRSDIYAFGIILFEMLTGRPPFMSDGFGELLNMHLNVPPPAARSFEPSVPVAIETLVARCLLKAPLERPAAMGEVQAALKAGAGPGIVVRGVSSPDIGGTLAASPEPFRGPTVRSSLAPVSTGAFASTAQVKTGRLGLGLGVAGGALLLTLVVGAWTLLRPGASSLPAAQTLPAASVGAPLAQIPSAPAPRGPVSANPAVGVGAAAHASVPLVHLRLETEPSSARVVRLVDGVVLGVTPLVLDLPRASVPFEVRLERRGFVPIIRTLAADRDSDATWALSPLTPATPKPKRPRRVEEEPDDAPAKL